MLGNQIRWVMLTILKQSGVTLIELLIAIVIAGILMMIGVNSFSKWNQNQQVKTAAESILNGMQVARSEAVRRNTTARFVLCGGATSSWEILAVSAPAPLPSASLACGAGSDAQAGEVRIQERTALEGSTNAQIQITPNGTKAVTFNGMGRVVANTGGDAGTPAITQVDVTNPKGDRPMRVTVSTGGSLRMCDPSPKLQAGDPRAC